MRNCELVKRREQEEEDTVTLEELEKKRVEALTILEKEREIVEQERAVYESIADKISKRHMSHHTGLLMHLQRNSKVVYMMPCTISMWSSQRQ